jgi:hypothetical protein
MSIIATVQQLPVVILKGDHHETDCSTTTGSQDLDSSSIDTKLTWMFSHANYHTNHAIV